MSLLLIPSCAIQQDQFGHAVRTNNIALAKKTVSPRFARMQIQETNEKWSVPIQYAIVNRDREMASFLLNNDCHTSLDGQNLCYYSAANGYEDMALFFAEKNQGSHSDIAKAKSDSRRKSQRNAQTAMIGLGFLAVLMNGPGMWGDNSGGNQSDTCGQCGASHSGSGVCGVCQSRMAGLR